MISAEMVLMIALCSNRIRTSHDNPKDAYLYFVNILSQLGKTHKNEVSRF